MLEEILDYLHNYFVIKTVSGAFEIRDGMLLDVEGLKDGQYYRIHGSIFNDGVHQSGDLSLADETFEGYIDFMAIPQAVLKTAQEIEDWQAANAKTIDSPYQSESFGGYSYTKSSGFTFDGSGALWEKRFGPKLKGYKKLPCH